MLLKAKQKRMGSRYGRLEEERAFLLQSQNEEDDLKRRKPATHFGMFNLHPEINLVGVCDKNESNLIKAKEMKPDNYQLLGLESRCLVDANQFKYV